jgi:hypothetical protein
MYVCICINIYIHIHTYICTYVSAAQKRTHGALPDAVHATKKSSTPVASGTTTEKGAADKDKATTNRNLAKGKKR